MNSMRTLGPILGAFLVNAALGAETVSSPPALEDSAKRDAPSHPPIALHPENPHYFLFRGKPTVLVTSGEHYGAVLNRDFDFVKYLDTLAADGLELTRTFSGAYVEPQGAFRIEKNTLAPAAGRLICPWARSEVPGYAGGGNRFDLAKWDDAYFARLRSFLGAASERGIVVEYVFFCPFYEDSQWQLSPMNAANNLAGIGAIERTKVYTLDGHGGLLDVQLALVREVIARTQEFDNLFFEIANEPYFGGITLEWQHRIADEIVAAQRDRSRRHLIAQNIANGKAKVVDPHPAVSIFNFHYASPPDTVALNWNLGKVIGDDETGFRGTADLHYRMEGWEFVLAGGALYDHLDYSFAVGHEDGTFRYPPTQPGGGGKDLRHQLRVLKEFIHSFDFVRMAPDASFVVATKPETVRARTLSQPGEQYAVYFFGGKQVIVTLQVPGGDWITEWVDTRSGRVEKREEVGIRPAGQVTIASPAYRDDVALRVVRKSER